MILSNTPQNEAVLSNVGEIGEFRIRNSAKAFSILSSGLYANKIRAIIRELSCNALDSHTAAGTNKPFDVHLPTQLSPFFYIRDYGTGLTHDQVTSIYTTYFESTKTNSNAFIGALGLGSKSPFSYTDNFTVTAIKDGRKGVYTAFINEAGVPSIALMMEEETTEESGVEVRFAVETFYDFGKFKDEARNVYRWFKEQPNFTGAEIEIPKIEYDTEDLIPGVHVRTPRSGTERAVAVMGNIAYPLDVPSADKSLPNGLHKLLSCGLVMEFGIGELDFQASREGLSYIPQTIASIKSKLEAVNARLADFVAEEADKLNNEWERAYFLNEKKRNPLFTSAVSQYAEDTEFPLVGENYYSGASLTRKVVDLESEFNIALKSFSIYSHNNKCRNETPRNINFAPLGQQSAYHSGWNFTVEKHTYFVENDTKIGALERSKHHWRNSKHESDTVYVIESADKTKPIKLDEFYASIHNPPEAQRKKASDLLMKDRVKGGGIGRNVTILQMEERGGARWHNSSKDLVWRDAGKVDSFDDTKEHYYIPLSGFNPQWTNNELQFVSCAALVNNLQQSGIKELNFTVYGVRKGDIEDIKTRKNWVNLEDHVTKVMDKLGEKPILGCVRAKLANTDIMRYNIDMIAKELPADSPAMKFIGDFVGVAKADNYGAIQHLTNMFCKNFSIDALVTKYQNLVYEFNVRYPLINKLDNYNVKEVDIIGYIKLVDSVKTV